VIVLQYGMQGSASSWVFNVLKEIAELRGSSQYEILSKSGIGQRAWRRLKYVRYGTHNIPEDAWDLCEISNLIDDKDIVVLKTHSDLPSNAIELLLKDKMKVFVTMRDPIDAAWSIYKKGILARELGKNQFSHINSFEHALKIIKTDCQKTSTWIHNKNVHIVTYEMIKYCPEACVKLMMNCLGVGESEDAINALSTLVPGNFSTGEPGEGYKNIDHPNIEGFFNSMYSSIKR